jgi:hypothetical protein
MRWTRWCRKTSDASADGEVVWSWLLDAEVKLVTMLAHRTDNGDKKPITKESTKETVKPSRRECRRVSANLW